MSVEDRLMSTTTDDDEIIAEGGDFSREELEIAEEYAEKILEIGEQVTIGRVLLASFAVLMVILSGFAGWYWVIPRDAIDVETNYFQGGGGHVVLVQVDNSGTRAVSDISVQINFKDLSGQLIGSTSWQGASLPAHSSVAGDDLELIIQGHTTWAEYELSASVDWVDGNGAAHSFNFEHRVGNYTYEWYSDSAPRHNWWM
jgi:hypothetical protein